MVNVASQCGYASVQGSGGPLPSAHGQGSGGNGIRAISSARRARPGREHRRFLLLSFRRLCFRCLQSVTSMARPPSTFLHLKAAAPGVFGTEALKWNFTKFLIDRGSRSCRFGSSRWRCQDRAPASQVPGAWVARRQNGVKPHRGGCGVALPLDHGRGGDVIIPTQRRVAEWSDVPDRNQA